MTVSLTTESLNGLNLLTNHDVESTLSENIDASFNASLKNDSTHWVTRRKNELLYKQFKDAESLGIELPRADLPFHDRDIVPEDIERDELGRIVWNDLPNANTIADYDRAVDIANAKVGKKQFRAIGEIEKSILEESQLAEQLHQDVASRAGFGGHVGGFIGGFGAALTDPVNQYFLLAGAPFAFHSLASAMVGEAAFNVVAESVVQSQLREQRKAQGMTDEEIDQLELQRIGMAGLFGAAFGAGARGLVKAVPFIRTGGAAIKRILKGEPEAVDAMIKSIESQREHLPQDTKDLLDVAKDARGIEKSVPQREPSLDDLITHARRFDEAITASREGRLISVADEAEHILTEAWKRKKGQFEEDYVRSLHPEVRDLFTREQLNNVARQLHEQRILLALEKGEKVPVEVLREYPKIDALEIQGWRKTQDEFTQDFLASIDKETLARAKAKPVYGVDFKKAAKERHAKAVKEALEKDLPVPEKVLKEYPQLKPKWTFTKQQFLDKFYRELPEDLRGLSREEANKIGRLIHEQSIISALEHRLPVPENILKEYPTLTKYKEIVDALPEKPLPGKVDVIRQILDRQPDTLSGLSRIQKAADDLDSRLKGIVQTVNDNRNEIAVGNTKLDDVQIGLPDRDGNTRTLTVKDFLEEQKGYDGVIETIKKCLGR